MSPETYGSCEATSILLEKAGNQLQLPKLYLYTTRLQCQPGNVPGMDTVAKGCVILTGRIGDTPPWIPALKPEGKGVHKKLSVPAPVPRYSVVIEGHPSDIFRLCGDQVGAASATG